MTDGESQSPSFLSPNSPEGDSERVEQYETVTSSEVVRRLQEVRTTIYRRYCMLRVSRHIVYSMVGRSSHVRVHTI